MRSSSERAPTVSRREVIVGAAAAGLLAGCTGRPAARPADPLAADPPVHTAVAAYDLDAAVRGDVAGVLRGIGERAAAAPGGTEVLVGLGASLFDRPVLRDRRPRQLTPMPVFPGDVLEPARTHGDVFVQAGATSADAARGLLDRVAGPLAARWRVEGSRSGTGRSGGRPTATNLFGFAEGHGNPAPDRVPATVRAHDGEPGWAAGGTYLAVRTIRFATAMWNADPVEAQERMIGRRRDGRWLDGADPAAEPDFARDPAGRTTPLDAHVRLARGGGAPEMLRRGYTYRQPGEEGLLFLAYQRDLDRGFAGVQRRLAGEPLARYVLPVGGGYFFVPPQRPGTWWGEPLFA